MNGSTLKQDNLTRRADVVIVGGGIIGLSIARELARRGGRDVTVIERGELGKEASWAAGGILAPQVEADKPNEFFLLACASRDRYDEFAAALTAETGIDVELDKTGTLYLGFNADDEREMRRRYEWQTREGLQLEWLLTEEARRLEPNISDQIHCALLFPNDYQVENRQLVKALIAANERLGVKLVTNCEARSLRIQKKRVFGVETSEEYVAAPVIVAAAGAWTSQLAPEQPSSDLKIEPVRGQMVCFKASRLVRHVIYSSRGYLVPRRDGRLLAGSTSEHVGFDKRVTEDGVKSITSMASEIAPSLKDLPVDNSWAGFRPHAEDDLPVLGPDAEVEGLFYATGHYRNGILLAPITAELIVESIVNGVRSSLLERFSPNRFRTIAMGV
jgi:glycine oxidase